MMKMPSLKWIHKILWQSGHIFYKKKQRTRRLSGCVSVHFYLAACNATHSIAVAILSVHLSIRHLYCDKTKWWSADILIPHETAITLVFRHHTGWCAMPPSLSNIGRKSPTPFEKCRLRSISAYNVSTIRDSEKRSIMTNIKLTTGFWTSYRSFVTPKSRKGGSKSDFFRFLE